MSKAAIYLDYAAATPLDPKVLEAMLPYLRTNFYNPSANYLAAASVRHDLEAARARVASWLGAKPSEIIFTAGATEANNLAITGIMKQYPKANIVLSSIEHESVLAPSHNYDYRITKVKSDGRLDLDALKASIDATTALVSVIYANNEIGTIQPISEVAKIIASERSARLAQGSKLPILLHTDAAQAANYLDLHVSRLGVDLLSLNGGKIYGPKQSGVLYVKSVVQLEPLIYGGGQERGLRSGTESVANCIGLAAALDMAQSTRQEESQRLALLKRQFMSHLSAAVKGIEFNGSLKYRLPNNVHISLASQDNERLLMSLDAAGVQAAAGSACSASDLQPSHVLRAIGKSDEAARSSLRLSLGRQTTWSQLDQVVRLLQTLV